MNNTHFPHGDDHRAQRLHRLRRVVAWVALVVLGLGLVSALSAAARGTGTPSPGQHSVAGAH